MKLFDLPEEDIWRDVSGYEGLYKVNRAGDILRIGKRVTTVRGHSQTVHECILKPYKGQVYLSKGGHVNTVNVRDIVARAFIPEYSDGCKVFKIDPDGPDSLNNITLHAEQCLCRPADANDWADVPGYEGLYQASRKGEIRSLDHVSSYTMNGTQCARIERGQTLKLHVNDDGYFSCLLCKEGVSRLWTVHRVIALTFIPNPDNKPQVNHIDGDKLNNEASNLEWVTRSENMQHAKRTHLWDPKSCGDIARRLAGIPVVCVTDGNEFRSINQAAQFYGMDFESVKESITLNRPRKGLQFKYGSE